LQKAGAIFKTNGGDLLISKVIICQRLTTNLHKITFMNGESRYYEEQEALDYIDTYLSKLQILIKEGLGDPCSQCQYRKEPEIQCLKCVCGEDKFRLFYPFEEVDLQAHLCDRCEMIDCPMKIATRVIYKCQWFAETPLVWIDVLHQVPVIEEGK